MIAVTGAGGFIGSRLVDALLARGDRVLALDLPRRLPTNLTEAGEDRHLAYRACDVTRPASVRKALAGPLEAVFHAAATVGVGSYVESPMETIETSVLGTRTIIRECLPRRARLVYLSSSEVFGRNPKVPWKEDSDRVLGDPSLDRWSYSSSKGICEHLVNAAHSQFGLPTTIVRPFNIYGPRQRPAFVVPITIHRVLNGQRPVIYGDGRQTRCFTYIDDLVDGLLRSLDRPSGIGQTFNLGNPKERTMNATVELVVRACGSRLTPVHEDPRAKFGSGFDEIPRRVPDVTRARRVLGWRARTELPIGLRATVEWARAHPDWLRSPLS
ncbi:MAG: NAD-dependent epimerase/dehydratase family protein [Thermoplasmata archaeon]